MLLAAVALAATDTSQCTADGAYAAWGCKEGRWYSESCVHEESCFEVTTPSIEYEMAALEQFVNYHRLNVSVNYVGFEAARQAHFEAVQQDLPRVFYW